MELPNWMPVIFYAVVLTVFLGVYSLLTFERDNEKKPFSNLVFLTAFMLINDFVSRMYIYDGFPNWLVVACTYINFAVLPALGILWYRFVRSVLTAEERRAARVYNMAIYIIAGIGIGILIVNPVLGLVFSFDSTGNYFRGPLFFFPAGSTFLCIVISEILLSTQVRSLGKDVFTSLLLFPLPPLIGGVIAMFAYGIPWMPLGIALSMVVLFATLQYTSMGTDFLTGLVNRRKLDELLEERIARAHAGRSFAAVMIDIDDFKQINDNLGHTVGDSALAETAHILRRSVRTSDVVARYGGDEFVLLLDVREDNDVEDVLARIREEVQVFNQEKHGFTLELSMGSYVYDPYEFPSAKAYMEYLDGLMYADKLEHKRAKYARSASA